MSISDEDTEHGRPFILDVEAPASALLKSQRDSLFIKEEKH